MARNIQAEAAGDMPVDEQPTVEPAQPEPSPLAFWRYIGAEQRVYPHVPVTVDAGDVIVHDGPPADDGRWEQHPGPLTREPDNTPKPAPVERADHATAQE